MEKGSERTREENKAELRARTLGKFNVETREEIRSKICSRLINLEFFCIYVYLSKNPSS